MTPELIKAIAKVAAYPADGPKRYTFAALIPWTYIQALRAELEAAGIDWRAFR